MVAKGPNLQNATTVKPVAEGKQRFRAFRTRDSRCSSSSTIELIPTPQQIAISSPQLLQ